MILNRRIVFEYRALPIGTVAEGSRIGEEDSSAIIKGYLIANGRIFGSVKQVEFFGWSLCAVIAIVTDYHVAGSTLFGGYQNDACGGPGTVYSCRGSVFQHFDRFDIRCVEVVDAAGVDYHAIDHI